MLKSWLIGRFWLQSQKSEFFEFYSISLGTYKKVPNNWKHLKLKFDYINRLWRSVLNFNATLYCVAEPNFVIRPKNNRPIETRPSIKDFEIWYLNPPITIGFYGNGPDPDTSSLTFNPLKGTVYTYETVSCHWYFKFKPE